MEWSPSHSSSFYVALGAGLLALLVLAHAAGTARSARSVLLILLRAGVLGVLLAILLDPVRVQESRLPEEPPSAVFLVDCSRSMALEQPVSRLEHAKRWMRQAESQLAAERRPRLELFGFGAELEAHDQTGQLRPVADESRLRDALERLPARLGDDAPKGVVLFSDGRSTENTGFDQVARAYKRLGVPIHVVPLGNPQSVGDVAIQDVVVPREARPGTRLPIRVVIRSRGHEGERAELRVRSLTDPNVKPLASLPLTLTDGELARDLVIETNQAQGPLVVEVPPLPREAIAENNRVPFQITAKSNKIRVIYMEGTPSPEYHWIRDALVEDPEIECLAMEVDAQNNLHQGLHRVNDRSHGYPTTREELFSYDVVICSDINRGAFSQQQLDWTVELVAQRGGGFAMIGGVTSFGAGQWDQTVWDGMIPIDMSGDANRGQSTLWETLKVQVPPEVEDHPIWHIVDDPARNREILDSMPVFYGSNLTDRLKPAATALGLAPVQALAPRRYIPQRQQPLPVPRNRRGTPPAKQGPRDGLMPVFSCQPYGKGRSFALSADSTDSWGRDFERLWGEGDNRYFRKFWRNVVRWLAENSANGNRRLTVETDKVLYHPGEPIRVSAHAFDEHAEPTQSYRLLARLQGVDATPASNEKTPRSAPKRSTSMIPRADDGTYRAELTVPTLDRLPAPRPNEAATVRKVVLRVLAYQRDRIAAQADLDIQIMDDSPEFRDPRPDRPLLETLARDSGGSVLNNSADLARLLQTYQAGPGERVVSRTPVWDQPLLWLLLIGLLTTEWIVRRTRGLA